MITFSQLNSLVLESSFFENNNEYKLLSFLEESVDFKKSTRKTITLTALCLETNKKRGFIFFEDLDFYNPRITKGQSNTISEQNTPEQIFSTVYGLMFEDYDIGCGGSLDVVYLSVDKASVEKDVIELNKKYKKGDDSSFRGFTLSVFGVKELSSKQSIKNIRQSYNLDI